MKKSCRYCHGGMHGEAALLHHEESCLLNPANVDRSYRALQSLGNREPIVVHACGAPGSWVRSVQENPQVALTALALLEAFYNAGRHGPPAQVWKETEQYLRENRRIDPLTPSKSP